MTRRPASSRRARKAPPKSPPKAQPKSRAASKRVQRSRKPNPLDDFIAAGVRALDLKIDKAWLPAVRGHLEVTLGHGALVAAFDLPDDTEPAPVFEA